MIERLRRAVCWTVGHRAIIVGTCKQTKAHHCTKRQVWCGRCNRIQYDDGTWRVATTGEWAKRKFRQWQQ